MANDCADISRVQPAKLSFSMKRMKIKALESTIGTLAVELTNRSSADGPGSGILMSSR